MEPGNNNYKHLKDETPYWLIKVDEIIDYVRNEKRDGTCQMADYYQKPRNEGH